jgi:hypothetical protein
VPAWDSRNSDSRPLGIYSRQVAMRLWVSLAARQLVAVILAIGAALLLVRVTLAPADQGAVVSQLQGDLPVVRYRDMIAAP